MASAEDRTADTRAKRPDSDPSTSSGGNASGSDTSVASERAGGRHDLLVARELGEPLDPFEGLDVPPPDGPVPVEQEVPGQLRAVRGRDLPVDLGHLEPVPLDQGLTRLEDV